MNTHIDLVIKLQKIYDDHAERYQKGELNKPDDFEKLGVIIENAKIGNYHDFASPFATPKMQLAQDLFDCGLLNTRQDVIDGKYDDESPDDIIDPGVTIK